MDELNKLYDIPRKIGQAWVETDQILPLLDGLDEVKREHRADCAEAINAFRQDHGLLPLVVCSRMAEYQDLKLKLRLYGAIVVQPLSPQQVDSYLTEIGPAGAVVRRAMGHDAMLREMLDSPLMLNIVTVAYAGQPESQPQLSGTLKERRDHLFGAYVDQMFRRRGVVHGYTPGQTVRWLGWLARQMADHGQTVFYLERLQLDWLPRRRQWFIRVGYSLAIGLVGGVFGLVIGRVAWLVYRRVGLKSSLSESELVGCLVNGLVSGLVGGLVLGLISWLSKGLSVSEIETRAVPNQGIHRLARNALVVGLGVGLVVGLVVWAGQRAGQRTGRRAGRRAGQRTGWLSY